MMHGIRTVGGGARESTGGGPSTPATISIGPDFGNPRELEVGVNLDLASLALSNTKTVGVNVDLHSVAAAFTAQTVGVDLAMPTIAAAYAAQTVGVDLAMPLVAPNYNIAGAGVALTMPSLALSHSKSVGAHLSGSALGAPFFQGIGITTQTANSTSVVMTPDTTPNNGDFLVVNIGSASAANEPTLTSPAGWTHLRTTSNGAAPANLHTYYKLAGAGEPSSYTFTDGSNNAHVATIIRLTAVDTSTPINVENAATGNSADPVSPSITTTAANCFMLTVCAQVNALTQTYTPPAGYVERADHTGTNLGVAQVTSETATRVQAAAGASGTATHDSNQLAGTDWVAHHIAIAPGVLTLAS